MVTHRPWYITRDDDMIQDNCLVLVKSFMNPFFLNWYSFKEVNSLCEITGSQ